MSETALTDSGLVRLREVMEGHVESGRVPGLVWLVGRHGEVRVGVAGAVGADGRDPMRRDAIFRISSMAKPVAAVAASILIEDGRLRLDEPVDRLLPELAQRRVLARPDAALDDTVPAHRSITVRDLLTFRMGTGWDFGSADQPAVMAAIAELALGAGPPAPAGPPGPDEWMRRFGTLPLAYQPGERWLYHTSAEVLGVLVARAVDQPLDIFLHDRIFEPLGMTDTGFAVPPEDVGRLGPCFGTSPDTGERVVYDPPDGQWSRSPAFPSAGAGLVSTVDDYLAFAEMLQGGGSYQGLRILSRPSVEAIITNHLTPEQIAASRPDPSGALGWGFGLGVQVRRAGPRSVGRYGWDGGLGTSWANDPAHDLIGILLTNEAWSSPDPPTVFQDFWSCAYACIGD